MKKPITPPPPPLVRAPSAAVVAFAAILQALGLTIGTSHERGVAWPVLVAIWMRIARMAQRFATIAAHVAAGTLRPPRPHPPAPPTGGRRCIRRSTHA